MNNLAMLQEFPQVMTTRNLPLIAAISAVFAIFGRLVRGVSTSGAIAGAAICFTLITGAGWGAFVGLCTIFALTWIATRIGYSRKQRLGRAESRRGRNAWQVLANTGIAALCAGLYLHWRTSVLLVCVGAALTEATADTVSSEIGQALGGTPRLITNLKAVAIGTDGALTGVGTLAGSAAALAVSAICAATGLVSWHDFGVCFFAGVLGMFADSLLGATLERWSVLNNNGVNFLSTAIAAVLVAAVLR